MTKVHLLILTCGPGQGLIILLSGPPGTGKTLTAEAGKIIDPTFELSADAK
jgi:ATP-dependent 26S proteasome regulatory subunit